MGIDFVSMSKVKSGLLIAASAFSASFVSAATLTSTSAFLDNALSSFSASLVSKVTEAFRTFFAPVFTTFL